MIDYVEGMSCFTFGWAAWTCPSTYGFLWNENDIYKIYINHGHRKDGRVTIKSEGSIIIDSWLLAVIIAWTSIFISCFIYWANDENFIEWNNSKFIIEWTYRCW